MPTVQSNGCPIHYEIEGPDNKPVLMLCNSLGTTLHMWDGPDAGADAAFPRRCATTGAATESPASRPAPTTWRCSAATRSRCSTPPRSHKTHWCGLSMGGMVGMWLGANAPQRVNRLILSNTSAYFPDKEIWNGRIKTVQEKGLQAIVGGTMERWFTKDFREREPKKIQWMVDMFLATKPEGYIACGEAVRDMDHREIIKTIKAPTHGHRRQAGRRHHRRDGGGDPQEHSGRQHDAVRCRPHRERRAASTTTPTRCSVSCCRSNGVRREHLRRRVSPGRREPVPPIIAWTPYGKHIPFDPKRFLNAGVKDEHVSDYTAFEAPDPTFWVPHGYAVVVVDTRGTWYSEGTAHYLAPEEAQDFYDAIEWAGTQPWSNGKVGLSGVSYLAQLQWRVAELNPPHLAAINPWEGWTDTYREVATHGGIPDTHFWPALWNRWGASTTMIEDLEAETESIRCSTISGLEEGGFLQNHRAGLRGRELDRSGPAHARHARGLQAHRVEAEMARDPRPEEVGALLRAGERPQAADLLRSFPQRRRQRPEVLARR